MVNGAPPATTALPRRRNLVRNALREIEKIVPSAQWGTVVIQPDQTVRVSRIGCANSSADAQPAGTATSTTASQSARRSVALTARQIKKNRRAADHQAALASSARLASGAAPAADAPSADASAGGPSQSAIAAASAAPSPAEHHHHPNSVAAVFTASCDITASASAAAACASCVSLAFFPGCEDPPPSTGAPMNGRPGFSWCWRALAKLHSVGGLMFNIHSFIIIIIT